VIALATAAIAAFALAMIGSLATLRARAERLAHGMTRELRESRERLALAIEGSNQAMFDWDVGTGAVVMTEQWSRITGAGSHPLATTMGELEALVHPEDLAHVRGETADLLAGRLAFYHVEHRVRTVTGGWRWVATRANVVERDDAGRALRVAGTNIDITDRKEMDRLKNEFIATVSHELRTPLTAIIGALGLLKKKVAPDLPPDAALFLGMAQQNSEQLAALINDVLDLEKIESGLMPFDEGAVVIAPLLERAVALNTPYADRFEVRLELGRPLPEATVSGDPDRLLQVMANLVSNAVKFSPAGSAVTVSAAARDGTVRIAVADAGPGIPDEFRGRIFEKFAQADGSDTRKKGGTGLGLSICRAIVERLGGTIGYESEAGKGTVFYFELPLRA
jgi:PAS domain S-box-containing protein